MVLLEVAEEGESEVRVVFGAVEDSEEGGLVYVGEIEIGVTDEFDEVVVVIVRMLLLLLFREVRGVRRRDCEETRRG